jgi:hypothetical protein
MEEEERRQGSGGARAVRCWRSRSSGGARGGVLDPETAEPSAPMTAVEQMVSVREL